ncbi:hypothetical protein CRYUN_Cryun38cG0068100 [Craigia yunnanensis]
MNHHFTQHDDGVSYGEMASTFCRLVKLFKAVVSMALLALLLQVIWRYCCSCYRKVRNHVKQCLSFSFSSACNKDPSTIAAVENILKYTFKNKNHLVEALTHASFSENMSYERLEFVGDAALGLAVAMHFFCLEQQKLTPGKLTKLRENSVSNEKLARVAAKHGLYWFVRRNNTASLDRDVKNYEKAVKQGDDQNITVKIPYILADIVESLAGAVYLDVNFDLTKLWMIFRDILGVDKITLPKDEADESSEITGAQGELYRLCGKRKLEKPVYREVKSGGCKHEKKYVYLVEIKIGDRVLGKKGNKKSCVKDAKNSAAYLLICSLQESGIM